MPEKCLFFFRCAIVTFVSSQVKEKIDAAKTILDGKHFVAGLNAESGDKVLLSSEDFQTLYEKPSRNLIEFYIRLMRLLLVNRATDDEFLIKLVDINESSTSSQSSEFMIVVSSAHYLRMYMINFV